ncbi:MAG: acyltransferase, partial [Kiritimatiellae bacterium]|nr:acyltransferase [Kiritimatiellia bacterium]
MNLCERTGARLGAAGFVCALAVVLIHCQSMRVWFSGEASDFGINGICDERLDAAIRFFLSYTFVRTAVPFFFVITGFFLARSGNGWLENIKKRALSLYIPFVIWNAANVALNVCAGRLSDEGSLVLAEKIFGWNTMSRLGCMQFWYIQAVFVFLLLWPAVSMLMRNRWTVVALFSVLFAGWIGMYRYHLGQAMQAGNFLWMCCGAAAGMYSVNTREW